MALIMDLHQQFVADVAEGRKMPVSTVEKLADGRALTGKQALAAGLVDKLGGLETATATLREMVKLSDKAPILEGPEKKLPFLPRLLGATLQALTESLGQASLHPGSPDLILQYRQ